LSNRFTRYGILFVVSAPSGAGKTTLCDALRQTDELGEGGFVSVPQRTDNGCVLTRVDFHQSGSA